MPLIKSSSPEAIAKNIVELKRDNARKGKEKGANGKTRSHAQIIAIALSQARQSKGK